MYVFYFVLLFIGSFMLLDSTVLDDEDICISLKDWSKLSFEA
jgi:hypothetical protein